MAEQNSKTIPPYVTWGVFKSTMDTLAETTVPSGPLDRRVLHTLSGADHGALMSALRFLGLADSENRATPGYVELVELTKAPPNSEDFQDKFLALLDLKYKSILDRVDLERGTVSELEKAFREEMGVAQGQMMTKTIRFFVKAFVDGGGYEGMSPHITKPKPKARSANKASNNGKKASRTAKNNAEEITRLPAQDSGIPDGFDRMPIPGVPGAYIQYPVDITESQCNLLSSAVDFLKVYAAMEDDDR